MPLKKSKEKKEKEAKVKEKGKDAKKELKKDGKKSDKSGSKVKGQPAPTTQQLAQMQQMEREARQRAAHAEPPPDVTLQMQKVRVLPAIPPECTCGRHDTHQHQQQQRQVRQASSGGRDGRATSQGRPVTSQAVQRQADGTYATVQQVRRTQQGNGTYATVQQVRGAGGAGTYATVQEVRGSQGVGTYATVNEALTGGGPPGANTYATVQEVHAAAVSATYATVQESRASQGSEPTYGTVKAARVSMQGGASEYYATMQQARAGLHAGADPLYSTVQRPLPAPAAVASDNYATVQEVKGPPATSAPPPPSSSSPAAAAVMATSAAVVLNDKHAAVPPARSAPANTTYASAQQVRAAKSAKQAHVHEPLPLPPRGPIVSGATPGSSNQNASENGRSGNGNGRGPPTLQPLSQRRTEEQKAKAAGGIPYDGPAPPDMGEGSEDEMGEGGFLRGGRLRSSLPVVRSPNKTLEKPLGDSTFDTMSNMSTTTSGTKSSKKKSKSLFRSCAARSGLVFLIHRNETKRALLPNEVTSIDTVRALFVRSFPEQLSMSYFESPKRKVYVLDQTTNVYYELEDLKDVKDRAVLKIYETEASSAARSPSRSPKTARGSAYYAATGGGVSSGGGPDGSGPHSPAHHAVPPRAFADPSQQAELDLLDEWNRRGMDPAGHLGRAFLQPTVFPPLPYKAKAASLPAQSNFIYQQEMAQYGGAAYTMPPGGQPLSPSHQLYKIPSNQSSPSRAQPLSQNSPTHRAYVINHDVIYPPPGSPSRVAPLAHLGVVGNQRHSVAYIPDGSTGFPPDSRMPQSRSYHDYYEGSSRSGSATPTASDQETTNRMDKMEAQLANLAAWVQTAVVQRDGGSRPGSARSNASITSDTSAKSKSENATPVRSPSTPPLTGLSDVSSATPTPQPALPADMQTSIRTLNSRAKELKAELRNLRRMQLANAESMRETLHQTFLKIKEVLSSVPGAQNAPLRAARNKANISMKRYQDEARQVDQDLADLEAAVEELRNDVLSKRCRVQSGEVDSMALALSSVSKALADLKGKYPSLSEQMKSVMAGEMEVVVKEEKYLHDQPQSLDNGLVRCKKLTRTLYTLKRLASVQEEKVPQPISVAVVTQPATADKRNILENIQAVMPDHEARLQSLETAESVRERKKRVMANQEALRFEKSLELAQKQLRETNNIEQVEQRQEKLLNGLIKQELGEGREPLIPLTDTTKRLTINAASKDATKEIRPGVANGGGGADKGQGQVKEGPGQGQGPGQSPPQKPPRTMLHDTPGQAKVVQGAGSQPDTVQSSTYALPTAPESAHYAVSPPVGMQVVQRGSEVGSTGKPPMPAPTCTSTPINGNNSGGGGSATKNVTFSPSVTEITDVSPDQKGRKVPPPPPPRRSSRSSLRVQSPQGTPVRRGVSPPAYENIENFPAKVDSTDGPSGQGGPVGGGGGGGGGGGPPPGMVLISRVTGDPASQSRPQGRPMNKFQQELAEGIYANLNRPDLQNQHVNAVKVLHDPSVKEESKLRVELGGGSDNESTTSSADSQSGTIRRNPKAAAKDGSGAGSGSSSAGVTLREGKKTPPPPPVRRSSHLSKTPNVEPVKEEADRPKSVHEIQQQFIQLEQQQQQQQQQQQVPPSTRGSHCQPPTANGGANQAVWQKQGQLANQNGSAPKPKVAPPVQNVTSSGGGSGSGSGGEGGGGCGGSGPPVAPPPATNGDAHSDSDSSLSVQSIVTKFSTTQTLNSQTSKVVIQRQSVKKCEETEIF